MYIYIYKSEERNLHSDSPLTDTKKKSNRHHPPPPQNTIYMR